MSFLFDSNAMLGRRSVHTPLGNPHSAEALLSEMDRLGIAEALVYHAMALDGHPPEGNARLMREIEGKPRLHPCWVLLPSTGEMPPPARLVDRMCEAGVRAARLCPGRHRFQITQSNVGDLLQALEAARIPLFLDYGLASWSEEKIDYERLEGLCERYPALPFIIVGEGFGAPRRMFPLWNRVRNLHLETSYYQACQGLSDIASRFGPERLLLGTGLPTRAPGPPLAQLRYDFLSDDDRAAIGGGNLRRMLSNAHLGALPALDVRLGPDASAIDLPDHPIVDAHAHLGGWFSTYVHAGDADAMVRAMDRLGIAATAIIAFDAIAADMKGGNDRVAMAMKRHPGRFLGYTTIDPNEPEKVVPELTRCFDTLGFHAIKFHCETHGYPADGPNYAPALEYADAHHKAVLIHGRITAKMLQRYPRAQFLAAHVGGWDGRAAREEIALAKEYPNIHCELCCSTIFNGALEKLVEAVGPDRVVHGSDTPLMDAGYQLGRVLAARLGPEAKRKILFENARRLFHLPEGFGT